MLSRQTSHRAAPTTRLHVRPDRTGGWHVQAEGDDHTLSEHTSETEAERAASRRAAHGDADEVIVHDRYERVHRLPPDAHGGVHPR